MTLPYPQNYDGLKSAVTHGAEEDSWIGVVALRLDCASQSRAGSRRRHRCQRMKEASSVGESGCCGEDCIRTWFHSVVLQEEWNGSSAGCSEALVLYLGAAMANALRWNIVIASKKHGLRTFSQENKEGG